MLQAAAPTTLVERETMSAADALNEPASIGRQPAHLRNVITTITTPVRKVAGSCILFL